MHNNNETILNELVYYQHILVDKRFFTTLKIIFEFLHSENKFCNPKKKTIL